MKQHANNEGIRLKNWYTGEVLYDKLGSTSNVQALNCRPTIFSMRPFYEFYASIEKFWSEEYLSRWSEIKMKIEESDGYTMKTKELKYGAIVARRKDPRCSGLIQ
ncbi:nitric oxide synthase 1-like [Artemia franciscana]|uniref:Nitric oxide synthase (NOS) domain-containing protein n=1 Tax=Artemia franciscana TaxID=6661 RepID=A0AA88HHB3_ARTSF|nr:hypothetical protein QYM36_012483 [Artemia franciscana]